MTVWDMTGDQFKERLGSLTTPRAVFNNAHNIYEFLAGIFGESCDDSLLREWAFQWYAEETGEDYDKIYKKWLGVAK